MDERVTADLAAPPAALSKRRPRRRRSLVAAAFACGSPGFAVGARRASGVWWSMHGGPAVRYITAPATRADRALGDDDRTVNPVLTIIVGSYVSGVIQQLYCDYNTE